MVVVKEDGNEFFSFFLFVIDDGFLIKCKGKGFVVLKVLVVCKIKVVVIEVLLDEVMIK